MSSSASSVPEQRALAAVAAHHLMAEATAWLWCEGDVFELEKTFIDRLRLPEGEKASIQLALLEVETVLMVSYWTSNQKPQPLAGAGKHYAFFIHPESFVVLHAGVGTWRS